MRYIICLAILFMAACSEDSKSKDYANSAEVFTVTNLKSAEDALNKINVNVEKGFQSTATKIDSLSAQLQSANATMKVLDYIAIGFSLVCLAIAFYLRNGASLCGSVLILVATITGVWIIYIVPLVLIATGALIVFTLLTLIYRIEQDLGHVKSLADLKQHIESSIKQLATTAETDAKKLLLALHDKISPSR